MLSARVFVHDLTPVKDEIKEVGNDARQESKG